MAWKNFQHMQIQNVRSMFYAYVDGLGSYAEQAESPEVQQLEMALAHTNNANFKVIHPLLIQRYRMPTLKFKAEPMRAVGLDIETDHTNGKPMLLGFWHPEAEEPYSYLHRPTLKTLFEVVKSHAENSHVRDFITWGNLDIQCIIRLFNPNETERQRISRGLSANIRNGQIIGSPPIMRRVGKAVFYVAHYIPGRSIKLGYIENGHETTSWIFNCSQFYPGRIADTAKGLGLEWRDFHRNTHLVDWSRFAADSHYRFEVLQSNKQDARIVNELADNLQSRFADVFKCYPTLLVSTGSLTDAAVGKMLSENVEEYRSNSWRWLVTHVWHDLSRSELAQAETLMAECFSAGYVDQFAIGYFPKICTADITAAYPHKIRELPDLRYSRLFVGRGRLEEDLHRTEIEGFEIESAMIRGKVTIPSTLKFHPITVKTYARENHRPTGTFYAAYTLDERRFCERYGATFEDEQYVIVALTERHQAPVGAVSDRLGEFRADLLAEMRESAAERKRLLDGQQYLVKVVDNSIYGKTVMTTELVEDLNETPQITGYVAGDRFNLLYGSLITARTRIQIAEACMAIAQAGGRPVMTMTDSIYWLGSAEMLPTEMIRENKTAGYFEAPEEVEGFYLLKTGQYEYRKGNTWHFKMRGLNVDREIVTGQRSFYRQTIKAACGQIDLNTHPADVVVPVKTRRLISIGAHDLKNLAAIQEGVTEIHPFVMSSKQVEPFVLNWRDALDAAVWLETPSLGADSFDRSANTYPLVWLRRLYEERIIATEELLAERKRRYSRATSNQLVQLKRLYVWAATERTNMIAPPGRLTDLTWEQLECWYQIPRKLLIGERV